MFKFGDLFLYFIITSLLIIFGFKSLSMKESVGKKVEIYIDNKLEFIQELTTKEKNLFVPTGLGGINLEFIDNKVRVVSSNSPKKLIVKQGFINKAGETLIGVPDKVIIKIIGESDLDYIIR